MGKKEYIGGTVLVLLLVGILWFVPQLQGEYFSPKVPPSERPALMNEYRRTWTQVIGGFALILGLYFTWRRVEVSQRTLEAAQDQQVTERFTRAIDQLGATDEKGEPRLEVRLGGIYALERVARDSLERDYGPIMEVLTAYVRKNAPLLPEAEEASESSSASTEEMSEQDSTPQEDTEQPVNSDWPPTIDLPTLPADIQAILDVVGRRKEPHAQHVHLSLRETNLQRAALVKANLEKVDLHGADLTASHLQETNLHKASLINVNLTQAVINKSDLRSAALWGAIFQQATIIQCHLQGAQLQDANLHRAILVQTDFSEADLGHASLLSADFKGAILRDANLAGADLRGAKRLTQEQIETAVGDKETRLPVYLQTPSKWRDSTDESTSQDD